MRHARFEPVDIAVTVRRASRRTAAVNAAITQDGTAVLDLQAWFAVEADVVNHDHAWAHRHGHPDDHKPLTDYELDGPSPFPFWSNFDAKPLDWIDDWEHYPGGRPEWAEWLRFVPIAEFEDPVMEACRLLVIADLPSFPAATPRTSGERRPYLGRTEPRSRGAVPPARALGRVVAVPRHGADRGPRPDRVPVRSLDCRRRTRRERLRSVARANRAARVTTPS